MQAQWINQNSSLHQQENGYLEAQFKETTVKEVVSLLDTHTREIQKRSRHLLEVHTDRIIGASYERQSYWLLAMNMAWRAGRRIASRPGRQGRSVRTTMSRKEWKKMLKEQKSMGTRETKLGAEVWGAE